MRTPSVTIIDIGLHSIAHPPSPTILTHARISRPDLESTAHSLLARSSKKTTDLSPAVFRSRLEHVFDASTMLDSSSPVEDKTAYAQPPVISPLPQCAAPPIRPQPPPSPEVLKVLPIACTW